MSNVVTVEIGERRQVFAADDLPLSIGGSGCHIALPDFNREGPVAYLGHDREELFVQPATDAIPPARLTCNGVPLTASRWISNGDELGIGGDRLRCGSQK